MSIARRSVLVAGFCVIACGGACRLLHPLDDYGGPPLVEDAGGRDVDEDADGGTQTLVRLGEPQTVLEGQLDIRSIAVDNRSVYWTVGPLAGDAGGLYKAGFDGTGVTRLAPELPPAGALAVDDALYVAAADPARGVFVTQKDGRGTHALGQGYAALGDVTTDSTYVFFGTNAGVVRAPKTGGDALLFFSDPAAGGIDARGRDVVVVGARGVVKVAKSDGTSCVVATPERSGVIAVDGTELFFPSTNGSIVKARAACNASTEEIVPPQGPLVFQSMTTDAEAVYWLTYAPQGMRAFRVTRRGGAVEPIGVSLESEPRGIVVRPDAVYWATGCCIVRSAKLP